jgi:hypothetical protein
LVALEGEEGLPGVDLRGQIGDARLMPVMEAVMTPLLGSLIPSANALAC